MGDKSRRCMCLYVMIFPNYVSTERVEVLHFEENYVSFLTRINVRASGGQVQGLCMFVCVSNDTYRLNVLKCLCCGRTYEENCVSGFRRSG